MPCFKTFREIHPRNKVQFYKKDTQTASNGLLTLALNYFAAYDDSQNYNVKSKLKITVAALHVTII